MQIILFVVYSFIIYSLILLYYCCVISVHLMNTGLCEFMFNLRIAIGI